ncbi:ATP-binding protein [Streptomyces sp. NPDC093990]|uniref:AAA family ATPase n=1 Tax=Streptomyces sp. NPDC093990 TaxID=3155306 RepID=UPI003446F340
MTTLFLTVGLPGAGKTTRARQLAEEHHALRLTPDEWMIALFGEPEAGGKRAVLEGRFLSLALEALRLGTDVILDFGCWSRDERSAIRWLARSAGASCRIVYVPVDVETQRARIAHRQSTTPDQTFLMSEADLVRWRALFEEPDAEELDGRGMDDPPEGSRSWPEWATDRWPSLVV